MKVILETRSVHQIGYLRFYFYHLVNASAGGLSYSVITADMIY